MRVLVVEDEPDLREVLAQLLREEGYAVDTAADGREGLFKAQAGSGGAPGGGGANREIGGPGSGPAGAGQYDAIVLDIMLPKLDGWGVLRELRKVGNAVPVLMLTARD